jgi:hypothetical protein
VIEAPPRPDHSPLPNSATGSWPSWELQVQGQPARHPRLAACLVPRIRQERGQNGRDQERTREENLSKAGRPVQDEGFLSRPPLCRKTAKDEMRAPGWGEGGRQAW